MGFVVTSPEPMTPMRMIHLPRGASTTRDLHVFGLRALREQLAALTSELRHRKQRAAKRVRTRRERLARERKPDPLYRATELDIARATRALR
jgi:hypothetical protein